MIDPGPIEPATDLASYSETDAPPPPPPPGILGREWNERISSKLPGFAPAIGRLRVCSGENWLTYSSALTVAVPRI
jgi:hypothetical protein